MFQYSTSTAMINMINLFMIIYSWYNCLMQVTSVLNISITHLWGWRWSRRWLDGEAWVPRHRLWRLLWCRICWVLAPNILAIEIGEWYPQGFPAFGNAAVGLDCKEVFLWCNFVLLSLVTGWCWWSLGNWWRIFSTSRNKCRQICGSYYDNHHGK